VAVSKAAYVKMSFADFTGIWVIAPLLESTLK
jgi:hypothetical protein